nr:rho GTPase-activating protein 33 isoform X3 [Geotrypetes seraphini]XP_033818409.1 rho GTPase-activating protein 33 isoform X3 [Geotrypetes seraphini]XP_033818410.1 rho GTPase-activating protein 33 isoform X3 [Geotrypetes seraphini]XP_033818411.1 rho GTPase-activating protein 33 isoform X3 [Geotrypetes seraphini]
MLSSAIHVLPSSGCRPEEDILFQWRLRRKMEQARDGALLVSTRRKSLSPPVRLPKQVKEVLETESASVEHGLGEKDCADISPPFVLDLYPVASPALEAQARGQSVQVPLHLHHVCDLLPCLHQNQPEPVTTSGITQEYKTLRDHSESLDDCRKNLIKLTSVEQQRCLVDEKQEAQLLGTCIHQTLSSGYKDKGLTLGPSHSKTCNREGSVSGDQDSAAYPIVSDVKQRTRTAQDTKGINYHSTVTTLKSQRPQMGQKVSKPFQLRQERKKKQERPEESPVRSAVGQVISERLFSSPPSPKYIGSKSMRGSRIRKEKSKAAQSTVVDPDPQQSLEMAAMLLEQAEESDGSEFQDDPLLHILRQQRDKLRDRLRADLIFKMKAVMTRSFSCTEETQEKHQPLLSMARSTDSLETTGEAPSRPLNTTTGASIKGKTSKRLSITKGHFPKLAECAHFHYENVDFGSIQLSLSLDRSEDAGAVGDVELEFVVQVTCQGKMWPVHRNYDEFCTLDAHLHRCIFDRRFSQLPELPPVAEVRYETERLMPMLSQYLEKLSLIVDSNISCGPVLTWMEIDNHGNRLLVNEEASINVPAIAAAQVIKRYTAQACDELSFEVGDIVSVIDMPPKDDTSWWRGKHGFQVGFFPSECVELFTERLTPGLKSEVDGQKCGIVTVTAPRNRPSPTTVAKKHGKLVGFLRTFMKSRPSKQRLKQRGILKERVFGCDLGEHLMNSGNDVPQVLRCCSEFIEKHGIVDGIYRLSGISSNIQKLRHEFDSERIPELARDIYLQDIHCVSSLCKLYFRELPNPLLTYQLYDKFAEAMSVQNEEDRLVRVHDVIQQLPPPHYRTLEFLMRHLARLATHSLDTSMHVKNLAIVWAPNLLRSMEIESVGLNGADAFQEVRVQSVVVEFLLNNVDILFSDKFTSIGKDGAGRCALSRPKSLLVSCTRLLSLEEAQARSQQALLTGSCAAQGNMLEPERGGGDRGTPVKYHTVIELPDERRKPRKASGGSWRLFFALGKTPVSLRRKSRLGDLFSVGESPAGARAETATLRSAKSEESLSSQTSSTGLQKLHRLRRPRSSSDAFPVPADPAGLPPPLLKPSRSCESMDSMDHDSVYTAPDFSRPTSAWLEDDDDLDFGPPFTGIGLDFDPLSFQYSPPPCLSLEDSSPSQSQPQSAAKRGSEEAQWGSEISSPPLPLSREKLAKSFSFTRKVVHALSPRGSRSPPMDISDPISSTVPAKILEMINSKASEGPNQSPPSQMISMLLKSSDGQLSDSCRQEVHRKLSLAESKVKVQATEHIDPPKSPELDMHQTRISTPLSIFRHVPPPPPPKNPARLMALALAESAQRALAQQPQRAQKEAASEPSSRFRRSLSLECGETLPPASGPLHAMASLQPGKKTDGPAPLQRQQSEGGLKSSEQHRNRREVRQVAGVCPFQASTGECRKPVSEAAIFGKNQEMNSNGSPNKELFLTFHSQPQATPPAPVGHPLEPQSKPLDSFLISSNITSPRNSKNPFANFSGHDPSHHPIPPPKPPPPLQVLHGKSGSLPCTSANLSLKAMPPARLWGPSKFPELQSKFFQQNTTNWSDYDSVKLMDLPRPSRMPIPPNSSYPFLAGQTEIQQQLRHRNSFPIYNKGEMPTQPEMEESSHNKHENLYYEITSDPPAYQPSTQSTHSAWSHQPRFQGLMAPPGRPCPEYTTALNASYGVIEQPWKEPIFQVGPPFSSPPESNASSPNYHPRQSYPPFKSTPPLLQQASKAMVSRTEVPPDPEALAYQRTATTANSYQYMSRLQPYFDNGKVCYKHLFPENRTSPEVGARGSPFLQPRVAPTNMGRDEVEEKPEPIYVNFPFITKVVAAAPNSKCKTHLELEPSLQEDPKEASLAQDVDNVVPNQPYSPTQQGNAKICTARPSLTPYDNISSSMEETPVGLGIIHMRSISDPGLEAQVSPYPRPDNEVTSECLSATKLQLSDKLSVTQKEWIGQASQEQIMEKTRLAPDTHFSSPASVWLKQELDQRPPPTGLYKQKYDVLPCGNTVLKFYRPPPSYWDPPSYHPPATNHNSLIPAVEYDAPIITYDPHFETGTAQHNFSHRSKAPQLGTRPGDMNGKILQERQAMTDRIVRHQSLKGQYTPYQLYGSHPNPNTTTVEPQYRNIDQAEGPLIVPPNMGYSSPLRKASYLTSNWTVNSEGQTRSYC